MRIVKKNTFDSVQAYELGFSPIGRPFMTVYFYFVGSTMIDTGQSHLRKEVLEITNQLQIRKLLLTHHHEDHSGNARAISDKHAVPVYGHAYGVRKMKKTFKILPYQHIIWGLAESVEMSIVPENIDDGDFHFQMIHTPGHSNDHTVYYEANHGWLFSGDLYLADRIKYFRVDENIVEEIASLKKVATLDFDYLFCSHFPKLENGRTRVLKKLQFLEALCDDVVNLWLKGQNAKEIMVNLGIKEKRLVKWFCAGNVSALNGIRSIIRSQN
ncbi:MAG: MBL fold metallo-hydrolase [Deltaproteobacteria bacterium]|nr:MBL fold metallo-hydrolase [Deltaproteobacteria bacterium]